MNGYSWFWLSWFLATVAAFLAVEIPSLVSHHSENTLSANVWRLLDVAPGQTVWQWDAFRFLTFGVWVVMGVWLTGHFFFDWWRG